MESDINLSFLKLSFKPTFSLSPFTFIKRLLSVVAAACVAASLVALRRVAGRARFRRQAGRAMVASVCVVGAVVAVMVIVALVDFNALFNALHSLFF